MTVDLPSLYDRYFLILFLSLEAGRFQPRHISLSSNCFMKLFRESTQLIFVLAKRDPAPYRCALVEGRFPTKVSFGYGPRRLDEIVRPELVQLDQLATPM